ncbi:hypothetical protein RHABOEDO_001590 [Candidatus Rhabdochlamydia oedothoracis]|uniref:Uncharacterized protein n=1 Tax=Candidatus Rhabdochlamydia oedothoracis TaxID=2720720 RepID=A0ABX8V8D0_9BACT|nr:MULTISPECIES: hypothetical protein [Rhabdochlamydia]KAG6559807.1 hypothetical protein RHOW815_000151 [Candidatus Rhabdochlamydia sp. W815]QYF49283.1 hypothetical protein RHABOEDO_001590 [Candidatus Rhabdochlamydia oedothoracis]
MKFIGGYNPLSCDNYINAGNYFQKQLSNHSNLVVRTAFVFAKIVGRGRDVLIHAGLGSIKLIASTAMAIYSIPAAAFDSIPIHHKIARQAWRHFGFVLFFVADIPLSLANILKIYPKLFCERIQEKLKVSPSILTYDQIIDDKNTDVGILNERQNIQLKQENKQLKNKNKKLSQEYINLLETKLPHENHLFDSFQ